MDSVSILAWWFIIFIIGLVGWPLAFSLLRHMPDQGFTLARPVGFLVSGYILWLGASFRLLQNINDVAILECAFRKSVIQARPDGECTGGRLLLVFCGVEDADVGAEEYGVWVFWVGLGDGDYCPGLGVVDLSFDVGE